jgi:hypothetical protein
MAAANTYTQIASTTLGSAAASVTFSSIAGTYTDLVLIVNAKGTAAANPGIRFNSDSATNYSSTAISGNGASAISFRYTSTDTLFSHNSGAAMNGVWTSFIANIQNYSNTTTYKSALTRYNASNELDGCVGLWRSTAAITSVTVVTSTNTYDIGSTFTLYGILAT